MYLFTLKERCRKCDSTLDFYLEKGECFAYCSGCKKAYEPCDSAWEQYRVKAAIATPGLLPGSSDRGDK
ncbi:hypothetical protein ES708_10687 [subsurface metagenome]